MMNKKIKEYIINEKKILDKEYEIECELIRLRNESPVGHGFNGISKEEIENIYGSPMEVIRDLVKACELLDLGITSNKYHNINEMAIHMIGSHKNH